jgi:3-deoxy-D-manno-octulosonic-acid transferase
MKRRYDLLYAIGALVSSPVLAIGLLKTGKWRTDWKGRFGRIPTLAEDDRPTLVLHGVSVGEINATRELVARLEASESPSVRVVISATTNTGFDRAKELYGDRHAVVRFPFDFSWMVGRFLDRLRPQVLALMELEVWPNLAQACCSRGIPLAVINGRLSDSSFGTYRWARRWIRPMFQDLTAVAAQTEEYAQRFRELGTPADRVTVTDTMKWDTVRFVDEVPGALELGAALGVDPSLPLVVAGSTGPGEEARLIAERPEGVQLLLVPRKPERFDEVARLAPGIVRRSERPDGFIRTDGAGQTIGGGGSEDVPQSLFLLDTMGELTKAYALADVAVVGRSFVPLGGSDPIEPVALGKATVVGPRHENFREVVSVLETVGGIRVTDRPMTAVSELLGAPDEARAMAEAGRDVIRKRQGATERHAELLLGLLRGGPGGEGTGSASSAATGGGGKQPRKRRFRRLFLWTLGLYMAVGYLTTAFDRVQVTEAVDPSMPLPLDERTLLSGVFSVHTGRSHDAYGTREQVASAAASAGLDFVVVGDHPPDVRRPDWSLWEPAFIDGVYVDGGVELRAPEAGKVLAMGVDSTYKQWQGTLGSFVEFLDSQGATALVVHGRGPRGSERWVHEGVEGLEGWEVLDISEFSRARARGPWSLYHVFLSLAGFPFGLADESLLHLMREGFDTPTVAAYDSLRQAGPLTATAGLNVHPKLKVGPVLVPSYGPFFRTLVSHLALDRELPSDPLPAQERMMEGVRRGELFISLGHHRVAESFRLYAVAEGGRTVAMGADVAGLGEPGQWAGGNVFLRGGFDSSPGDKVAFRVLRNGQEVEWVLGPDLEWAVPEPGVYRVEVYRYSLRLGRTFFRLRPWIFANPMGLR